MRILDIQRTSQWLFHHSTGSDSGRISEGSTYLILRLILTPFNAYRLAQLDQMRGR